MKSLVFFLLLVIVPLHASCEELSKKSLEGKWIFTHMILDGETNRSVNRLMEFLPENEVVSFNAAGVEASRATYAVNSNTIVYTDKRGAQTWKIIQFENDKLVVDHSGAVMHFKRQN